MYSEETKSSSLAKFLSIYDYVFVDTCSLMEDSFPVFMDNLTSSREYWKDGLHVIVLGECIEELKKHAANKDNQEARIEAKRALKILHHDHWFHKILEVTKSNSNYGFADNAIYTAVSSLRIQNKVLIITQDKTLATDLKKLNSLDSQRGRYVLVYRLNADGDLEENPGENGVYQARTYSSAPRRESKSSDHRFNHGLFHHDRPVKPQQNSSSSEETAGKPETPDTPIVSADKRLMANLNNPNYPLERKLSDIDDQLNAINALSSDEKAKLSLAYTYDELLEEKAKLSNRPAPAKPSNEVAIAHKEMPLPMKKIPEIKVGDPVPEAKPVEKPAPKAESKPLEPVKPQKLWFEYGSTIQEALTRTGAHYGILFRDASVPYFAMVHGPYDLTSRDLDALAKQVGILKTGEKKDLALGPLMAHIEKTEKDYKATLEIPAKSAPVVEKPIQNPAPSSTKEEVKKAEVKVEEAPKAEAPKAVAPVEKKVSHRKVSSVTAKAPKKAASPKTEAAPSLSVTAQDVNTAVPAGATLVVGVPNEGRKGYIERQIRRDDHTELSAVPNPNKGRRPASKSAAPKAPKITSKGTKPISKDVPQGDLAAILKEDKNLNAKINNPNYPVSDKIKDLEAQKGKLRSLKAAEQKDLYWTSAKISAKIKELSPKK
jgi:rRNA-processing protein FCF1